MSEYTSGGEARDDEPASPTRRTPSLFMEAYCRNIYRTPTSVPRGTAVTIMIVTRQRWGLNSDYHEQDNPKKTGCKSSLNHVTFGRSSVCVTLFSELENSHLNRRSVDRIDPVHGPAVEV